VPLRRDIPGAKSFELDHLLLDVNGTLANRARLIDGVEDRIARAREQLEVHLLSADTLGNLDETAGRLGVDAQRVTTGVEKRDYAQRMGADRCAAIGNGLNDVPMLETVRFGIAVIGPEGAGGAHPRRRGRGLRLDPRCLRPPARGRHDLVDAASVANQRSAAASSPGSRRRIVSTSSAGALSGEPESNGGAGSYSIPSWIAFATSTPASFAAR